MIDVTFDNAGWKIHARDMPPTLTKAHFAITMTREDDFITYVFKNGKRTPNTPRKINGVIVYEDDTTELEKIIDAVYVLAPSVHLPARVQSDIEQQMSRLNITAQDIHADNSSAECIICMDATSTHAFVPCGHKCSCEECASKLHTCPICRAAIERVIKIYS